MPDFPRLFLWVSPECHLWSTFLTYADCLTLFRTTVISRSDRHRVSIIFAASFARSQHWCSSYMFGIYQLWDNWWYIHIFVSVWLTCIVDEQILPLTIMHWFLWPSFMPRIVTVFIYGDVLWWSRRLIRILFRSNCMEHDFPWFFFLHVGVRIARLLLSGVDSGAAVTELLG